MERLKKAARLFELPKIKEDAKSGKTKYGQLVNVGRPSAALLA